MSDASRRPALLKRGAALLCAGALALAPFAVLDPAGASADGSAVVISEVYGGGGNSGAAYANDYVELYNPTGGSVDVSGMSVQYRSSGGTAEATGVTALTGVVPSHGHYLVALAAGGGPGAALPVADAPGNTNLSASKGTVILANGSAALDPGEGSVLGNAEVIDLVGYGASNTFENAAAPGADNATSVQRDADGTDTDDNAADFTAATPTPAGTGDDGPPPGGDPEKHPIAEIQGSGAASPLVNSEVITDGVVTAAYPTGGFEGFYLQTSGTGGTLPADHESSDAVFAYLGSAPAADYPAIGDHVQVTGEVIEFYGLTEISTTVAGIEPLEDAAVPAPVPTSYPAADAGREALEGMLLSPQGDFTVSDNYNVNNYAELVLAAGADPLVQPTDVARPGTPEAAAVARENAAREVTLDDGASLNYLTTGKDLALPWITASRSVRVGADVRFEKPIVLDYRNDAWKFQPTSQLTQADAADVQPASFEQTRTAAPAAVGGDLKIASFNVLNSFKETGEAYVADGGTCSSYKDRAGNPITVDSCNGDGPRGAWDETNRKRQQAKIVAAINTLGADVLSLEEIENSAKYAGEDRRDDALADLVDALNADAGAGTWKYVPSPAPADRPTTAEEDVIRTAFIYKAAKAEPVGDSHILTGSEAFSNAREPLAQVFEPVDGVANQRFLVVANHLKSKGSGVDDGTGQGNANPDRVAQAHDLVGFVDGLTESTGTRRVFLTGDFNSYTQEDPMQVLYDAGYTDIGSHESPGESTYVYDGLVGSLDHVLANDAALAEVTGAHVWNINSVESVAYEYSRYNYNATNFYDPSPFRSSDHDPLLVGIDVPDAVTPQDSNVSAQIDPRKLRPDTEATVRVRVSIGRKHHHSTPVEDGKVEVWLGPTRIGAGEVSDGRAEVALPAFGYDGRFTVQVRYLGSDAALPSTTTVDVRVHKGR